MLTIDDPPERPVCTSCMTPLVMIYAARTKRWVAMVAESNERLRTHQCDVRDRTVPWEPNPAAAERGRKHMAEIRQVMGWGPNPFIDNKSEEINEEKSA